MSRDELFGKVIKDLYFGNGKPALTVRIALQEDAMDRVEKNIVEIKENHKQAIRLVIATLISSIGGLIMIGVELYKNSK